MYAPQLFHGTSGEVTVPESSTARDSIRGAMPALGELEPVDPAGHDDRHVLVAGDDVQAEAREDDRRDEAPGRLGRGRGRVGSSRSRKPASSMIAA